MNKLIYKYTLTGLLPGGTVQVLMPKAAHFIHAAIQNYEYTVWAEVDPGDVVEPRTFLLLGTGDVVPDMYFHRGTFFLSLGLVAHLYEESRADVTLNSMTVLPLYKPCPKCGSIDGDETCPECEHRLTKSV